MNLRALSRVVTFVCLASPWIGATASAQVRARTVLTIHSGAEDFPANPILDAAIRAALKSTPAEPIQYFAEYLENDQFGEKEASLALGEYVRRKYRNRRIDVVIAMTNSSLQFVLANRELFPDTPIVFAGVGVPDDSVRSAGAGIAAVRVGSAYSQTVKVALELHPSTERVFVVARSPNRQNVDAARAELDQFSRRVRLTYLDEASLAGLLSAVKAVPPRSVILHIWHRNEPADESSQPVETARFVAEAAPVPVYGTIDANIGSGIVGGVVRGTRETGALVGDIARQVLDGRRPQDIPVAAAPIVPTFDWRQLQRWGIDPSQLPAGSEIRFRTRSAWEIYRPYIIATALVVVAQLLLIAGLLTQRARRRRAEEKIRLSEATLRTSYQRIRQLAGRVINAQEAARADIARDLHDDVCQKLVYVSMGVTGLKNSQGLIQDSQTQQAFLELERDTNAIFDGIRRLSHELHPATLRLLGVAPAVKAHCAEVEKRHGIRVIFKAEGDLGLPHPDVAVCLFRIAQEAIRNALIHGNARRIAVTLARSGDHVELTVTDDGRGFDLEQVKRSDSGMGLVSMEERAHAAGGTLDIVTAPGQGTTIRVRAPIAPLEAVREAEDTAAVEQSAAERLPAIR